MKVFTAINFISILLIFSACRSNIAQTAEEDRNAPPEIIENQPLQKVEREVFEARKTPALTAVGKINFIGQKWCSLILVAEDIAVTAGHCFLQSNFEFDLSKDIEPYYTSVIFRQQDGKRIENVQIKRVLKAESNPDYAIVRLNKKIPRSLIKSLEISRLKLDEMIAKPEKLGCAGFNGDKELGNEGLTLTVSRRIKIVPESSDQKRIDTSCYATYGSSGGLFFEENGGEYKIIGVIWGITDEKYNEKGELVKSENITTSITPISFFSDELIGIIKQN